MDWIKKLLTPKDWEYFNYVENPEWWEAESGYYRYRVCKNTGDFQYNSIHCLGLNPPEYVQQWLTIIGKPTFVFKNGVKMIKEK